MTPLARRIVEEKRPILLPLGIAIVANIVLYGLVVYPLGVRSAGAADRAAAAVMARQAAERDLDVARALVNGKASADKQLTAFYKKVLPADLTSARRMTYASLPILAEQTDVQYVRRSHHVEDIAPDSKLGRLTIRVVLHGDYESLRSFIYELEHAPEFVIIDDVTLAEASVTEPLTLTLNLSTYFRARGSGA